MGRSEPHRRGIARAVAALAAVALTVAAAGCAEDAEEGSATTSRATEAAPSATTAYAPTVDAELRGVTMVAVEGNQADGSATVVVLDPSAGTSRAIVGQGELGGTGSRIVGIDRIVGGAIVSVEKADGTGALWMVPDEGPAAALATGVGTPTGVGRLEVSPDGRWIAASLDGGLVVLGVDGGPPPGRIELEGGYPPSSLVWAPDGTRLAWTPYTGRGPCCTTMLSVDVDPTTGVVRPGGPVAEPISGFPWFDASGAIRSTGGEAGAPVPVDTDATGRLVLAVAPTAAGLEELVWWDSTDPRPRPLELPTGVDVWLAAWR